jgi:copper chaperone CopZ
MTNEIIIKAIQKINPNAEVSVSGNDINQITWENETTPIPVADIEAQIPTVEAEIEQEKQDAETKKASGKQKLKDLGLDDDEIKALMGA